MLAASQTHCGMLLHCGDMCRLDLPLGLSLAVDRVADRRVAFIKQRWNAGPFRNSSTASARLGGLHGKERGGDLGDSADLTRPAAGGEVPSPSENSSSLRGNQHMVDASTSTAQPGPCLKLPFQA